MASRIVYFLFYLSENNFCFATNKKEIATRRLRLQKKLEAIYKSIEEPDTNSCHKAAHIV